MVNKIKAEVIKKSTCQNDNTITTFQLFYPRFIHAELLTHKILVSNSASSRAIPVSKQIQTVCDDPVVPVEFGVNQPGMKADNTLMGQSYNDALQVWYNASCDSVLHARSFEMLGVHKQIANRVLEPFVWMHTIITGTEWANFYHLRRRVPGYDDAQPEIAELAERMWEAQNATEPTFLNPDQWHIPYVDFNPATNRYSVDGNEVTLEQALRISSSVCAQVSYRKADTSLDKAERIWSQLIGGDRVHASPFSHQAKPIYHQWWDSLHWKTIPGVTHQDVDGNLWSAQFKGWVMHRKLIKNEAVW
jgi:hypothetical protein